MNRVFKLYVYMMILAFLAMSGFGCSLKKEIRFTGKTMGTMYHIKAVTWFYQNRQTLQDQIDKRLKAINKSMSTYDKESEISRFNAFKSDGPFKISDDFYEVLSVAAIIYKETHGAWDGTVKPLVDLWGFSHRSASEGPFSPPPEAEIEKCLNFIGFDQIKLIEKGLIRKTNPNLTLDLASIAKGYGVDQIADVFLKHNIEDFLVEIGGEVYASGTKQKGKKWRIGINTPRNNASLNDVYKAIDLENLAMATSGDYRNFFESSGKRYSHIIDPRNGYPVTNHVVSVSVIAKTCTMADGLATGLMVIGPKEGIVLVNQLDDIEALILVQTPDGELTEYASAKFPSQ